MQIRTGNTDSESDPVGMNWMKMHFFYIERISNFSIFSILRIFEVRWPYAALFCLFIEFYIHILVHSCGPRLGCRAGIWTRDRPDTCPTCSSNWATLYHSDLRRTLRNRKTCNLSSKNDERGPVRVKRHTSVYFYKKVTVLKYFPSKWYRKVLYRSTRTVRMPNKVNSRSRRLR